MFPGIRATVRAATLLAIGATVVSGQYQTRTALEWRTIESGRFAYHFPRELEPWARIVAGKMAGIDTAVSRLAGFRSDQRIEVVLDDPFRVPNGSAWPLLDAPRVVLWAAPPSPREDIGNYVSWADMIATHEFAHLAHLLRPTRNQWQSLLWKIAPVELGPISRKTPRWVIEGYATHIEGTITGSGRPHGAWRRAILRQWAIEGSLPRYAQLDAMTGMYGGDFAYLAGSAFLEWLVARRGDTSLPDLWRRLSARNDRGFVEAFTGVFGEPPDVLYGRYTAELTAEAKRLEQSVRAAGDSGATVQRLSRETGDPAISTDGGRVALMLASATRPGRVVIWRTIPESDTAAARADRALLARDSGDVAPYRPFPPAKRALATLHAVGNQPYQDPRFFRDGRVLVWRNTAVGDGSWMPDLYVWDPQRSSVARLTRRANVRQGDPAPDGTTIAATRCSGGRCDLAFVDVSTGAVTVVAEGSDTRSFHRPRYSPDGRSLVVVVRDGGFWRIGIVNAAERSLRLITGSGVNYLDATFANDSTILATSDESGIPQVVRLRLDGALDRQVTAVTGAAIAPEVNPADGSVWFLSMHSRGWDVRSLPASRRAAVPATPLARVSPISLPVVPVPASTPYAPERKWVYFPGVLSTREGSSLMIGLANTDPVGRHELLVQAAITGDPVAGSAAWRGASAILTTRSRVTTTASVFALSQSEDRWRSLRGVSLSGELSRRFETRGVRAMLGATAAQAATGYPLESSRYTRALAFGELAASASRFRAGRRTAAGVVLSAASGTHGTSGVGRYLATASVGSNEIPLSIVAQMGRASTDHPAEHFTIGGHPATLAPPGVMNQQVAMPALPPRFVGRTVQTLRIGLPFYGAQLYSWSGRAWSGDSPRFEHVLGAECSASIAQISALGTPSVRITAGVGRWQNHVASAGDRRRPVQGYVLTQFGDWIR